MDASTPAQLVPAPNPIAAPESPTEQPIEEVVTGFPVVVMAEAVPVFHVPSGIHYRFSAACVGTEAARMSRTAEAARVSRATSARWARWTLSGRLHEVRAEVLSGMADEATFEATCLGWVSAHLATLMISHLPGRAPVHQHQMGLEPSREVAPARRLDFNLRNTLHKQVRRGARRVQHRRVE